MYHLTCKCGREVIVPRRELEAGEKSQVLFCVHCWFKIDIQWPGSYEAKKERA